MENNKLIMYRYRSVSYKLWFVKMRPEIKNLEGLLSQYIGTNKKIISSSTSSLTAAGDNYGGILLRSGYRFGKRRNRRPGRT
ncbi:hypothetical protein NQ317_012185 [Molorchus minor]|uniref:Uncharacterized protein n=1 Tax=Molorchus minor TaxID=1323400 RepID=A0ABQ9K5Y3_9CUCU|nr:hypothetical protein NQ317_012185 [Molorchus minor]